MNARPPDRATVRRTRVGAVLLVVGTVQFLVAHLVVQHAWPTPYSWTRNYLSDLGAVTCGGQPGDIVCSPLHAVMNSAFVLQGVLLIGGTVLTAGAWTASTARRVWQGHGIGPRGVSGQPLQ